MLTITTSKDEITPDLRRLLKLAQEDSGLRAVMGRAGANVLRKHFRARNAKPNKLGGKRTNFWSRVAQSVNAPRSAGSKIVIPINHPAIAQKVFGGTIRPTKAKNIAIPVDPRAHGKSPRSFAEGFLSYFPLKNGKGGGLGHLGEERKEVSRKAETLEDFEYRQKHHKARKVKVIKFDLYYVLRKSVTQQPDPKALPKDAVMVAAMHEAARILEDTRALRSAGGAGNSL